ncbi:MAG: flagellar biosynthesis protein FliR [Synergistaceae bacterium]|jgi:uncharacterized membrane protein YhhN|nr:flagellar biosynthesis protein FliR [Synergistaceae bacterium]
MLDILRLGDFFASLPERNVQALTALASFAGAIFVSRVVVRIQRLGDEVPSGDFAILCLRILLGFLLTAAVVFGYRSFLP